LRITGAVVLTAAALFVALVAFVTYRIGCDSGCVALQGSETTGEVGWRSVRDSWQWTAQLVLGGMASAAFIAGATALLANRAGVAAAATTGGSVLTVVASTFWE